MLGGYWITVPEVPGFLTVADSHYRPVVGAHHATVACDMESVADPTDSPRTVKPIDGG